MDVVRGTFPATHVRVLDPDELTEAARANAEQAEFLEWYGRRPSERRVPTPR